MTIDNAVKVDETPHDFRSKVRTMENHLEKMSHNAGEKIGSMVGDIASTTTQYVKTGKKFVEDNPVKGVAIAAGVGALIGSITTMTMRRRK